MRRLLSMLAVAALASGCVAYNDPCQPLVDNPQERVAYIGSELWIDKPNARHANNAIGQVAADAFVWVFKDSDTPADFGIVNGGSVRAEGLCVNRPILKPGPLTNGVLHEILLFENYVNAVDLSEQEVWDLFEHSAERLFAAPTPIASPFGGFMQVSGNVHVELDCGAPPLSRVKRLTINGQDLQTPGRPFPQVKFRVAMSSFVLAGGDSYTMLAGKGTDPSRNPVQAQRFGGIDSNVTAAYLKQSAFNESQGSGITVDTSRITFTLDAMNQPTCSVPGRPAQ